MAVGPKDEIPNLDDRSTKNRRRRREFGDLGTTHRGIGGGACRGTAARALGWPRRPPAAALQARGAVEGGAGSDATGRAAGRPTPRSSRHGEKTAGGLWPFSASGGSQRALGPSENDSGRRICPEEKARTSGVQVVNRNYDVGWQGMVLRWSASCFEELVVTWDLSAALLRRSSSP